jgi:glycosyltransferase involved in cell wall biosynthesis
MSESTAPTIDVTLVVPCRNEARFIGKCLDSLIANEYSHDGLEILVVDGMSTDGTAEIAGEYAARYPFIRVLQNHKRIIPAAMNLGIAAARANIIAKADAHSIYAPTYIAECVRCLQEYGVDNVGGVLITEPSNDTNVAKSIAFVLAHPFGSGNSRFRIGTPVPVAADTVACGCYRRDVFERIGLYNEDLIRSSDMDLNARLREAGGRIMLAPEIVARYFPSADMPDFFCRNVIDGFWALYPAKFGSRLARARHLLPLAALLALAGMGLLATIVPTLWMALAGIAATYAAVAVGCGLDLALRERSATIAIIVPMTFAVRHAAYAAGSCWGALRAITSQGFWAHIRHRALTAGVAGEQA